jgi:hypothetical protein
VPVSGGGGESGGIPEAPADDVIYSRRNATWYPDPIQANVPTPNGVYAVTRSGATVGWLDFITLGVAPLNSPAFTGVPTAPTASASTSTTQIATTAFVQGVVTALPPGPAGPQGPQGDPGPPGPAGATGSQGPQGDIGPAGPQGPAGATGSQGPAGATGSPGPPGADGAEGPAGAAGAEGPPGPSAVSADPENIARLGSDTLIYVPASGGGGVPEVPAGNGAYARFRSGATASWVDFVTLGVAPLNSPAFTGNPTAPTVLAASNSTTLLATTAFVQSAITARPGIPDAPVDSIPYCRSNGGWVVSPIPFDALLDNVFYARRNATWTPVQIQTDAASDGQPYVRRNAAWEPLDNNMGVF